MPFDICGYQFEGIFDFNENHPLQHQAGVYVIFCTFFRGHDKNIRDDYIIDVDESDDVKTSLENHSRTNSWLDWCNSSLSVAVFYTGNMLRVDRKRIVRKIEQEYQDTLHVPMQR